MTRKAIAYITGDKIFSKTKQLASHAASKPPDQGGATVVSQGSYSASFQAEVCLGIFKTDAADKIAKKPRIIRDLTSFHVHADQIAKQSAEIFVTRVGHEAARVG